MEQLGDKNMPPDYKWLLKEIMEIEYHQILTMVCALRCGKKCQCLQNYSSSYLNLLAVKEKSADMSFWNEGSDKHISS